MPRPKKTRIEDLARIRNNQRNCRERRRAYVAELEQKVKYYEKERVQCCSMLQGRAQKRKAFLETPFDPSSVDEDRRDQSLIDWVERPRADWEGVSIRTQTPSLTESSEPMGQSLEVEAPHTIHFANQSPLLSHSKNIESKQVFTPSQTLPDFSARIYNAGVDEPTYFPGLSTFYGPVDTAGIETLVYDRFQPVYPLLLWPLLTDETAREDRSMLCSLAYRLILQFNKKQYDEMEIEIKISCGFRLGRTQSEDCRVDIGVLFAVLAEISF